jgi:hypothetical protein
MRRIASVSVADATALDVVERRLRDRLLLVAQRHAFDPEEARDLYQTIWLQICVAMPGMTAEDR